MPMDNTIKIPPVWDTMTSSLRPESTGRADVIVPVFSIWKEGRTMAHPQRIYREPCYICLCPRGMIKQTWAHSYSEVEVQNAPCTVHLCF